MVAYVCVLANLFSFFVTSLLLCQSVERRMRSYYSNSYVRSSSRFHLCWCVSKIISREDGHCIQSPLIRTNFYHSASLYTHWNSVLNSICTALHIWLKCTLPGHNFIRHCQMWWFYCNILLQTMWNENCDCFEQMCEWEFFKRHKW